jgi:hypothetical protein
MLIAETTDALAAATSTLSLDAQKRAEKDAHKKALKAEAAEAKHAQTIASSKVIIKRVERNKVCLLSHCSLSYTDAPTEKIRHGSVGP